MKKIENMIYVSEAYLKTLKEKADKMEQLQETILFLNFVIEKYKVQAEKYRKLAAESIAKESQNVRKN